jgi:hypothetical protein
VQMQSIPGGQSQRGTDLRWDHQTTLLTQNQCGIHESSVPRIAQSWQVLRGRTAFHT